MFALSNSNPPLNVRERRPILHPLVHPDFGELMKGGQTCENSGGAVVVHVVEDNDEYSLEVA